jgi:hypothetical protein
MMKHSLLFYAFFISSFVFLGQEEASAEHVQIQDFPYYWGDVAFEGCKFYERSHFRDEKETGDLPVVPDKLKGICGIFQDLMESWCEFKQEGAWRFNKTTAGEIAKNSGLPPIEGWGRHVIKHFVEWLFEKSPGSENIQALRYSINNGFSNWFDSVVSGTLPPPPPPTEEGEGVSGDETETGSDDDVVEAETGGSDDDVVLVDRDEEEDTDGTAA